MGKFVLKRLLALIPTILIIVFVVYFILDLTPSDPGHLILGQMASEEAVAAKNAELGYDKPFTVRYAKYIWDLCHGSLGNSWLSGKGVFETVMARFPVTVTLAARRHADRRGDRRRAGRAGRGEAIHLLGRHGDHACHDAGVLSGFLDRHDAHTAVFAEVRLAPILRHGYL